MAKSLQERIVSARSTNRVTIETLEQLIADITAERDRLSKSHERASAESIDFALSEDDRDDAARNAEKYSRTVLALGTAIEGLTEQLIAKQESDGRKAQEAERAAALAERDEIAAEFGKFMPAAVEQMVSLFERIEANENRMLAAGLREADAEATARGMSRFIGNGSEALRFVKMRIPEFDGQHRCWPVDHERAMQIRIAERDSARAKAAAYQKSPEYKAEQARIAREKAKEHAKLHGFYRLSTGLAGKALIYPTEIQGKHGLGNALLYPDSWEGELPHAVAKELRKVEHLNVKLLQPEAAQ